MNRPLPPRPNGPPGERYLSYTDSIMIPSANGCTDVRGGPPSHPRISSPQPSSYSNSPSRTGTTSVATSPMSQHSAAASFFARAAQKLNISSKKKRKCQNNVPETPVFPTSYSDVIRNNPPSAPPYLLRTAGRLQAPGVGKVKVMVRICTPPPNTGNHSEHGAMILSVDARKKQVTLHDPSASGYITATRRTTAIVAPKTFAFDAVFPQDDSLAEICSSSLTDVIQGVVNGVDGCVFSFGYSRASKANTMFGKDQSSQTLGLLPCAITWLFRLINEHRDATGARFSVRVSAVEVSGKQESLKDLLSDVAQVSTETGVSTAPSVYLRDDPICGTQLENQSELRAPTAEQAAYYLDAAIAARSSADEDESRHSHLLFTLHIYQYRVERVKSGLPGVAGGRSRLHFIDLGSCSKSKDPNNVSLSLSALGNVILALLNGQRHIPHRDTKIAQLLRDSLGNLSCRTCMIAHVSSAMAQYNETLQVIQLASRIHRMRRRKIKFSSTSSEDSSTDESGRLRRPLRGFRMGTLREDMLYSSSLSDPDYTSSSEQSCDTVVYIGANGHSLSDRELTDNEGPPRNLPLLPRTNPRLPRRTSGSRSSGDEGSASDTGRAFSPADSGRMSISKMYGREAVASYSNRTPVMSPTLQHDTNRFNQSAPGTATLLCMSPGYQVARRTNVKQKMSSKSKTLSDCGGRYPNNEEGPNFMEQWVDGPAAAIYPDKKNPELWVDGPQAFMVKIKHGPRKHMRSSRQRNGNYSDGDVQSQRTLPIQRDEQEGEKWVDGPGRGNLRIVSNYSYPCKPNNSMCGNRKTVSAADVGQQPARLSVDTREPTMQISIPASPQTATVGTQSVVSLFRPNKCVQEDARPESETSLDSINAQASESRPTSFHSNENKADCAGKNFTAGKKEDVYLVKDWTLSLNCNKINSNVADASDESNNIGKSHSIATDLESRPNLNQETHSTQKHQTGLLQRAALNPPQEETPTSQTQSASRVTEWLKTVLTEEDIKISNSEPTPSIGLNSLALTDEVSHLGLEIFEKVTGNRSDLICCDDTVSEFDNRMFVTDEDDGQRKCASFYSSADTNKDSNPETEFANLLISNRESIYEIEADQQLELRRNVNSGQDVPDDETFSSVSCAGKEDAEKVALDAEVTRIQTARKLKALNSNCVKNEAKVTPYEASVKQVEIVREIHDAEQEDVARLRDARARCEFVGSKLSDLEEVSDEDSVLDGKHPLLVDRESQSNESVFAKEIYDKACSTIDVSLLKQNYTINPIVSSVNENQPAYYAQATVSVNSHPIYDIIGRPLPVYYQVQPDPAAPQTEAKKGQKTKPAKPGAVHKPPPPASTTSNKNHIKESLNKQKPKDSRTATNQNCTVSVSPSHASRTKDRCTNRTVRSSSQPATISSPTTRSNKPKKKEEKKKDEREKKNGSPPKTEPRLTHRDNDEKKHSLLIGERSFLSPYATVTKPRVARGSSSGHGSDNSSTISTEIHPQQLGSKSDKLHGGGTSSGYESMLRESEASCTSSLDDDSAASDSSNDKKKKTRKQKVAGSRRSRSCPARSNSESPSIGRRECPGAAQLPASPSSKVAWLDTRHIHRLKEEPLEIRMYDSEDVERLQRRRQDGLEVDEQRRERVILKNEEEFDQQLVSPKHRLRFERGNWLLDCKSLLCFSCRPATNTHL